MFQKNRYKIFKYLNAIKALFISSLFIVMFYDMKYLNSEEIDRLNNVLNIRYGRYNPYKEIEKEVNNGSITYKTIILDKDTEDYTTTSNNAKKYIDNGYDEFNDEDGDDGDDIERNENKIKVGVEEENNDKENGVKVFDNQRKIKSTIESKNKASRRKDIAAELNIGTSGIDIGAVYNYWFFGFRLSGAFLKLPLNGVVQEYIDLDIKGYNIGLSFLFRPFQGAFHVDFGLFYFNQGITGNYHIKLLPSEKEELAGYYLDSTIVLGLKFRVGVVPYFGFGWNINIWKNFLINIDIGLFVTGKLKYKSLDFRINEGGYSDDTYKLTGLEDVISYEKVKSILGETATNIMEKLVVWPVIKIGVGYRFNL